MEGPFVGVLVTRGLLFGVHIRSLDFWTLPYICPVELNKGLFWRKVQVRNRRHAVRAEIQQGMAGQPHSCGSAPEAGPTTIEARSWNVTVP